MSQADITPQEIAQAAGKSIEDIKVSRDRSMVTQMMEAGAVKKMWELYSDKKVDGIISDGGTSMVLMGAHIMGEFQFGMPKIIVCPAAMPAYISYWFGTMDITIMQFIVLWTSFRCQRLKDAV